jgi:hypothetical protein
MSVARAESQLANVLLVELLAALAEQFDREEQADEHTHRPARRLTAARRSSSFPRFNRERRHVAHR